MIIRPALITLTAVTLVSACTPLQQAPLLYSSKLTVGVDVSATTTETPGASASIGVKTVDAAYVPVAVSKESEEGPDGKPRTFEIEKIEAVYGEGTTQAQLDSLTAENKKKISDYLEAKKAEDAAQAKVTTLQSQIQAVENPTKIEQDNQNNLSKQLETAKTDLNNKKEEANKLFVEASKAASLLRTDKRDAMSVYGRFDSYSSASTESNNPQPNTASPSANLTVGKIFSTGVASQNLTEAVRIDMLTNAKTRCLEQQNKLIALADAADKPALAKLAIENCTPK